MTDPYLINGRLSVTSSLQTVVQPKVNAAPASVGKLCCKVGVPGGSSYLRSSELAPLLRHRLRLATAIALAAFGITLVRALLNIGPSGGPDAGALAVHSLTVAVMIALASLLWTTMPLSVRTLRLMELALFGVAALFLTYLHFVRVTSGEMLVMASSDADKSKVAWMATMVANMRWVLLIVLYGTFIPNTWRRSALIVGILAAIPLTLTTWSCTVCPVMGPISGPAPFFDSLVVLGMASAIAVFGSHKINVLQQQAVVARELGQYRLKQKLGSGGMGEVFLGEHIMLRRKCAIKMIRPDQAGDPTNLERFEREVQAMANLTHWNTVEVYDYGHAEDGTFYYVMEYLPGMSLEEMVDRFGPMPPERVIHFLRQICSALQEAHGFGMIHRDIKPSNVLVCERGGIHDVAKLLDFGLVQCLCMEKDVAKLTVQGVILGSPPYMSPEQALGKGELDARCDIYSVGALGYFLLTGQPPFVRDTAMAMLVAHAHEKPLPPGDLRPGIPQDLQDIVMKCLEKDPQRRYQSADELEQALSQCSAADLWTRQSGAQWWKDSERASQSAELPLLVG